MKGLVNPPKQITDNSTHILRAHKNTTPHIGVVQETIGVTDHNDTMIPTDIIKDISETAHNKLIFSRDMIHVAKVRLFL